ncbi:RNA polymerase sigma factor [Lignipirellula cremea]|uniref:ECF RNA polymerase sigma factor SigW n=1 Tax=Lignipirellula cremea TaxID=2528010 RepID=A0A518DWY9_9BACT|nr:sigma-70 family RNA polymerase sigma factor [Lignipirellula cremea]QDU96352.1 ECF RNA polymerase sigma factor SigW [Lignipirellula cremea]
MPKPITDLDFDAILKSSQSHIRAYIAGMGVPSHEVDDVAQDVFLEFYKNLDKTPHDVAPERWLKGIARNLCMNHFRKQKRRSQLQKEALAELLSRVEPPLEQLFEQSGAAVALENCFSKLPPKSRDLLSMRYRDDLSSRRIAEALDSTAEAVRVSLHRIRNGLKNCISDSLSGEQWQ